MGKCIGEIAWGKCPCCEKWETTIKILLKESENGRD